MPRPRVFVSHSHHDTDFTNRLVADLSAAGADVWVDVIGIDRGDFQERINEALEACQYFVLVLTPEALRSPWVRMETHAAIKRQAEGQIRQVLPVVALPVEPHMVPPIWNTFPRFDATSNYASALAGLSQALGLPAFPLRASDKRPARWIPRPVPSSLAH
jgi:TIR domain-containing protein